MKDKSKIRNAVRKAIKDSPKTCYRISKEFEITECELSLFVNGHRGLGVERMEELIEYLGWEIVVKPKKKGK